MIIKDVILKCTGWYSVHIQPNTAKLISQHFTVQMYNDPSDNAKATSERAMAMKWDILQLPIYLIPT